MRSYHLTEMQTLDLSVKVDIQSATVHGLSKIASTEQLQALVNAALDQVLGEPVGETVEIPATNGGFTMAMFNGNDIPAGTKLYAPKGQS